jgi:hypothetical protein
MVFFYPPYDGLKKRTNLTVSLFYPPYGGLKKSPTLRLSFFTRLMAV